MPAQILIVTWEFVAVSLVDLMVAIGLGVVVDYVVWHFIVCLVEAYS